MGRKYEPPPIISRRRAPSNLNWTLKEMPYHHQLKLGRRTSLGNLKFEETIIPIGNQGEIFESSDFHHLLGVSSCLSWRGSPAQTGERAEPFHWVSVQHYPLSLHPHYW